MSALLIAATIVAITVLVFGLFLPRHGRRDLVVSYLVLGIGVLAVTSALAASTTLSAGLGLGLFGVLSIIRIRSEELSQHEIAYYFAALVLGLLGGLGATHAAWIGALMLIVLAAVCLGDHPRFSRKAARQTLVLDRAHGDLASVHAHVERVLTGEIHEVSIVKTDLVNDTTTAVVRYTPTPLGAYTPAPAGADTDASTLEVAR